MDRQFAKTVTECQARLRAYIAGLGMPVDTVDDIAQEAFMEYYNAMDAKPRDTDELAWLKGIARNISMNHFRKEKRLKNHHMKLATMLEKTDSTLETVHHPEARFVILQRCIKKLAPRSRKILLMKYRKEMLAKTIAEIMDTTSESIRMTLVRIRKALKKCIEKKMQEECTI